MTNGIPHPFEIFWDTDEASYFIFVPDGCLLVNGIAATNDKVNNGNLALDFGDTPPEKVYCHVKQDKNEESGEKSWRFTIDGNEKDDDAKYNILIATFGQSENDGQSYDVVCSAISLGGGDTAFMGDAPYSEPTDGRSLETDSKNGLVVIQGATLKDGESGLALPVSGLQVRTSPPTHDGTEAGEIPHIVLDVIDREDVCNDGVWGAKTLTIKGKDGDKTVHFFGCNDATVVGEDGGGGASDVIGSEYISVSDETDQQGETKRKVEAKVSTSDPVPGSEEAGNTEAEHALLTHDTDQFVRSKKTFLGQSPADRSSKVVIDGPNAKLQAVSSDGAKTIEIDAASGVAEISHGMTLQRKIVLDPSALEADETVEVHNLTIKGEKKEDDKTFKVLANEDIDISSTPQVQSDWEQTDWTAKDFIKNKPTIPAKQVNADWNATSGKAQILNKPTLATVATSGDYEDLAHKPTIPTIPDITATPSGTGNVVTDVTADGHALTVTKGTVKEPSGSDYIDVSSTGVVSAKVPSDGSKGLVTTDTAQAVSAMKTFLAGIVCGTSDGKRSHYMPSNVEFYPAAGAMNGGFIDFHMNGDSSDYTSRIIEDTNGLHLLGSTSNGILLNGNAANKVRLNHHPTVGVSEADAALRKAVPTCGWVNDNYKVTEIVPDGNNAGISITPDTTNPKILKLKNTGMSERSLFLNGTAASNKFFGTGDINLTIAQKTLVQGEGIVLTPSGNDIVISATSAGGTTGFSGERTVLADVSYDIESHCLRKRFYTETWVNGVLKLSVLGEWEDYHQAVPETV